MINEPRTVVICYTAKCSLKCPYCVNNMSQTKLPTLLDKIGWKEYIRLFQKSFIIKPDNINLAGSGEPLEHPDTIDFLDAFLSMGCTVSIQTNLTFGEKLFDYLLKNPEYANRITLIASLHLGAFRANKKPMMTKHFIEIYRKLAEFPLRFGIVVPLAPNILFDNELEDTLTTLWEIKPFIPGLLELEHYFNGKQYPGSYTPEERKRVIELLNKWKTIRPHPENPSTLKYMNPYPKLKGYVCFIERFVCQIDVDGKIFTCYPAAPIALLGEPCGAFLKEKPCVHEECRCKTSGYHYCLEPMGITPQEYYANYYRGLGRHDIANIIEGG